ncbi:hypothetical protein PISMIDRAFT_10721 [Pisolithus microcarpus 441]|uniref:Uncharacterized protein n=1 Tax=Pisolithus microcarpus 441 TaxID=765257 RepID=A0A0C9ZN02_9AGAM|nr:hypothetical protein BKA83DRAFT_10721 [Pisolithus microcarpus]KIK23762.1 hypothetical protein PISMIDRAFT_10721 [Pisolithus microcarpus 441]
MPYPSLPSNTGPTFLDFRFQLASTTLRCRLSQNPKVLWYVVDSALGLPSLFTFAYQTIEFSLIAALLELTAITDPSHTASAQTPLVTNHPNVSDGEVKLEFADANLSASMGPLHMDGPPLPARPIFAPFNVDHCVSLAPSTVRTTDSAPTGDNYIESASVQPVLPYVLAVNGNEIKPENEEETSRPVEKIASELPPSPLPACTPHLSLKHGFMPDSFAASEEFDSVNTQLLRERWAQVREGLEERRKPIFSEVTNLTPSRKRYRK